jgi:iron(III) transport system permease protein
MKELPITFLLSPIGFESLALKTWSAANEAMFDAAAPYALAIMFFSAAFVGLLLVQEKTRRTEKPGRKPAGRA